MAVRRLAPDDMQPRDFRFTPEMESFAVSQIAKYPEGRQMSAVVPVLWFVQKEAGGWLSKPALEGVAERLDMPYMRVLEVASFYTMFNLEPVGEFYVQVCGTTPCALRGANQLMDVLRRKVGPEKVVSADGKFSWLEVECLGACCNAPMLQLNDDYFEDLTPEILEEIIEDLRAGRERKPGSQAGRRGSEPDGGSHTLDDPALFDGSLIGAWRRRFEEPPVAAEAKAEAEKVSTDKRVAEHGDTRPAKPDSGRPTERPVVDAPAQRAASGQEPQRAADEAAQSSTAKAVVAGSEVRTENSPSPSSDKSFVGTPVKQEDGRPVAEVTGETTKEAGTPPTELPGRRTGLESKPSVAGTFKGNEPVDGAASSTGEKVAETVLNEPKPGAGQKDGKPGGGDDAAG